MIICLVSSIALSCLCAAGCIRSDLENLESSIAAVQSIPSDKGTSIEEEASGEKTVSYENDVDKACKNYYALIKSGILEDMNLSTKEKREEALKAASIQDALKYYNVTVSI